MTSVLYHSSTIASVSPLRNDRVERAEKTFQTPSSDFSRPTVPPAQTMETLTHHVPADAPVRLTYRTSKAVGYSERHGLGICGLMVCSSQQGFRVEGCVRSVRD